ncbi:MAG TPA: BTAD domain-containing putative transcriptional regulator [Solirubrobacteraceae bacterium]|nr:BTAD domain-containing putative transcriptional regulator [Solirubrobacteraceae bacterium]
MLDVRLLGHVSLSLEGRPLPPLSSARAESLLAYVLLHRDAPQPRGRVAFVLWPESPEAQARTNLRHLLHKLRYSLPDADRYLDLGQRALQWRTDAPFRLDVAEFEEAVARDAPAEAVALYGGDLLPDCYDDWVLVERERLRQLYLHALEALAIQHSESGDHAAAVDCAERLVRGDPLREDSHRLLMTVHDAAGDRARALRAYHACAAALERELDVRPSAATHALYARLLPDAAAARRVGRSALVGRALEWERLQEAWRAAEAGRAQMVLIGGEAGIGKTRLVEELSSFCAQRGAAVAEGRSYAAEGALAYGPVLQWLQTLGTPRLPAREHRHELMEAVAEALLAPASPLLLVADDIQWADQETLQLLHYVLRSRTGARLLVAATARSGEVEGALEELLAALRVRRQIEEIELERLSRSETDALAASLGPAPERLYEETEGNPLFIVEAVRAGAALTPRVRAVISSRMAHVSAPARELLGVAATAGREFAPDVVGAAAGVDEDALVHGLDELWRRGIVRAHGPDAYDFSHGKLRDAVYEQLSPARRRRNHLRVADALERLADADAVSAQLAAHYEQAGVPDRALEWYERAASVAMRMHASADAVRWITRAIALTEDPARELELLTALPAPLMAVDGYQSPRTLAMHERALELVNRLGREPAAPILRSIALARLAAGDHDGTRAVADELASRAARDGDRMLEVEAEYLLGVTAFWQGALDRARRHLEAAIERVGAEGSPEHLRHYGTDPAVVCGTRLAIVLWLQGLPDDAVLACDAALERAARLDHPYTTATARSFAGLLAVELGDVQRLREDVARIDARGGPQAAIFAEALRGYVEVNGGRRANMARIRRALTAAEAAAAPGIEVLMGRIALATLEAGGEVRGALAVAERMLERSGQVRVYEAEFRRVRAVCLRAIGRDEEADAELDAASSLASRQGARMLEERVLRTTRNARGTAAAGSSSPR